MATRTMTIGNIIIAIKPPAAVCADVRLGSIEVEATGTSTLDGRRRVMALLVPNNQFANPAELAAYVAANAYLVL